MKRFVLKSTALLLTLVCLLSLFSAVYRRTTTWQNLNLSEGIEKYNTMPQRIDFAVFGPSHGRDSFHREDYEGAVSQEGFFNFSLGAQTAQYDYLQMRQYADWIVPGAVVVLTVTYASPFWTDTFEKFAEKQGRYYRILSPKNIVDCDLEKWCLQRMFPVLTASVGALASAFLTPPALLDEEEVKRDTVMTSAEEVQQQIEPTRQSFESLMEPAMPDGNPVMMDAYHQMLTMCRERGWQAILVTPPYLQEYNDLFSQEELAAYSALVSGLSQEYGVPWLDYSHDERFAGKYEYYRNIDHQNQFGAAAFAACFQEDLQALNKT